MKELMDGGKGAVLDGIEYAATFWAQHPKLAESAPRVQIALTEKGDVGHFLYTKLLEWLECLSLLDQLPRAIGALEVLANVAVVSGA